MLGVLTMLVEYPMEDGSVGRRGLKVELGSAPLERYAGDRRDEILGMTFETLASLLGVPGVRVTVDNERDIIRVLADAKRAEETYGDVFEACPLDNDGDGNCHVHPQGCPRMRVKTPVNEPVPGSEMVRGVTPGMELDDLGKRAYSAYRKRVGGRSVITNEPLPEWDDLRLDIKQGWAAAAVAVAVGEHPTGQPLAP